MNISFAGAFQSVQIKSVQAKPHTQTADVATSKHKTVSPERNIKDAYVPSTTDSVVTDKPRVAFKFPSILSDSFKTQETLVIDFGMPFEQKIVQMFGEGIGGFHASLG